MSSPLPANLYDSQGPLFNDRWVNPFKANSSLAPGTVVKLVAADTVDATSATTDTVLGVTWDSAIAGRSINVITRGIVRAASDNAVSFGDLLVGGVSGVWHDTGSNQLSFPILPVSGGTTPFPRALALESQATVGSTFLAALF